MYQPREGRSPLVLTSATQPGKIASPHSSRIDSFEVHRPMLCTRLDLDIDLAGTVEAGPSRPPPHCTRHPQPPPPPPTAPGRPTPADPPDAPKTRCGLYSACRGRRCSGVARLPHHPSPLARRVVALGAKSGIEHWSLAGITKSGGKVGMLVGGRLCCAHLDYGSVSIIVPIWRRPRAARAPFVFPRPYFTEALARSSRLGPRLTSYCPKFDQLVPTRSTCASTMWFFTPYHR